MAQTVLLESAIEAGYRFLCLLDERKYNITNAMWFYYSDIEKWKLLLHAKEFEKTNVEKTINSYREISELFYAHQEQIQGIDLNDIKLVFNENELLKLFKAIFHIEGNSRTRLVSSYINQHYIEDALIYRNIVDDMITNLA